MQDKMYQEKYLKYKAKYLELKAELEGGQFSLFKRKAPQSDAPDSAAYKNIMHKVLVHDRTIDQVAARLKTVQGLLAASIENDKKTAAARELAEKKAEEARRLAAIKAKEEYTMNQAKTADAEYQRQKDAAQAAIDAKRLAKKHFSSNSDALSISGGEWNLFSKVSDSDETKKLRAQEADLKKSLDELKKELSKLENDLETQRFADIAQWEAENKRKADLAKQKARELQLAQSNSLKIGSEAAKAAQRAKELADAAEAENNRVKMAKCKMENKKNRSAECTDFYNNTFNHSNTSTPQKFY